MELTASVIGTNLVLKQQEKDEITIEGFVDKIFFILQGNNPTVFEVKNKNKVWITFHGNPRYNRLSLYVEEFLWGNNVKIGGDIISFEGNIENNNEIKKFIIKPRDIDIEESTLEKLIYKLKEEK
jgi:hypothetical protein